jgi:uncharacterized protein YkwD
MALAAILFLPAAALAGPTRVVIVDQIHCKTVKGPSGSRTICSVKRQQKTRPSRREVPDSPSLARAPLRRVPARPFIDLDGKLDVPPPLTDRDFPQPIPEPRHEAELPDALRELPAPMQAVPDNLAPNPAPNRARRFSPPSPRLDDHALPAPLPPASRPDAARPADLRATVLTVQESQVFTLLNTERKRRGLAPLRVDPRAVEVARAHSRDMCQRRFFSHDSPDGKRPWDRLRAGGVRFTAAAENIAVGYSSGYAAHQGWLASPGHRVNRLSQSYTRMGVGLHVCPGQVSMPYWTEVFVK